MIAKIQALLEEVEGLQAANAEEVEALRIKYLSKKGILNALMADFRNVAAEQKKEVGMKLNELKNATQEKIAALKNAIETQDCSSQDIDLTRTAYPVKLGTRHPLTIVKNEIVDIFSRLGFTLAEGPEIEDDWHVYSSMNFADDHLPATCRIHSLLRLIRTLCSVRILHPYRHVLWNVSNHLFVLSARDVYTVTKLFQRVHTASSIR